jgi:hypothetical protein
VIQKLKLQAAEKSTLKAKLGLLGTKTVRGTVESFILLLHSLSSSLHSLEAKTRLSPTHISSKQAVRS